MLVLTFLRALFKNFVSVNVLYHKSSVLTDSDNKFAFRFRLSVM